MFKNFCRCNAAVSDLYDGKSKNKIAVVFFFLIPMAAFEGIWSHSLQRGQPLPHLLTSPLLVTHPF